MSLDDVIPAVVLAYAGSAGAALVVGAFIVLCVVGTASALLVLSGVVFLIYQAWYELALEVHRSAFRPWSYLGMTVTKTGVALVIGVALVGVGLGPKAPIVGAIIGIAIAQTFSPTFHRQPVRAKAWAQLVPMISYAAPLSVSLVIGQAHLYADRVFLGWLINGEAAAKYSATADLILLSLGMLMMALNLATLPRVVSAYRGGAVLDVEAQLRQGLVGIAFLATPAAAGLVVLSSNVAAVILPSEYQAHFKGLVIAFVVVALLSGIKAYYVDLVFQVTQRTRTQVFTNAVPFVINLAALPLVIPIFGAQGAVLCACVTQGLALLIGLQCAKKYLTLPALPLSASLPIGIATIAMVGALLPVSGFIGATWLTVQVALGVSVYLGTFLGCKPYFATIGKPKTR